MVRLVDGGEENTLTSEVPGACVRGVLPDDDVEGVGRMVPVEDAEGVGRMVPVEDAEGVGRVVLVADAEGVGRGVCAVGVVDGTEAVRPVSGLGCAGRTARREEEAAAGEELRAR